MAKARFERLWALIGGNAIWDLLKWLWENHAVLSVGMIALFVYLREEVRELVSRWGELHWVDRLFVVTLLILLACGLLLIVVTTIRTLRRSDSNVNPKSDIATTPSKSASPRKLRIHTATWGSSNRYKDVREALESRVNNDQLQLLVSNEAFGDPDPGNTNKNLIVTYSFEGGKAIETARPQSALLVLPEDTWLLDHTEKAQNEAVRLRSYSEAQGTIWITYPRPHYDGLSKASPFVSIDFQVINATPHFTRLNREHPMIGTVFFDGQPLSHQGRVDEASSQLNAPIGHDGCLRIHIPLTSDEADRIGKAVARLKDLPNRLQSDPKFAFPGIRVKFIQTQPDGSAKEQTEHIGPVMA